MRSYFAVLGSLLLGCLFLSPLVAQEFPKIPRVLPPEGPPLPKAEVLRIANRVVNLTQKFEKLPKDLIPEIGIFPKAVYSALRLNEFYDHDKDIAKADFLLDEAERRLSEYEKSKTLGIQNQGLIVRGYRSIVDGSIQPYGIVFPKDFPPGEVGENAKKYPIYVWLHGRGDKSTDMHFIYERMKQVGQLGPVDAVVIHPFGRQCVGYKSAGEVDVLDCIRAFQGLAAGQGLAVESWPNNKPILIGFSMGGAGAWHLGAHYSDRFRAVAPGAGFAETAQYTKTDPDSVPWYVKKLWGMYDVPGYTRNLFNVPVIAYSGENDKQIQAARVMETAFKAEGRELTHLIGPGVEHKYEAGTLRELLKRLAELPKKAEAREGFLQTRTLQYNSTEQVFVLRLLKHWEDSRIDWKIDGKGNDEVAHIATKNIRTFDLLNLSYGKILIDGKNVLLHVEPEGTKSKLRRFQKTDGEWKQIEMAALKPGMLIKRPGQHGPIDHAFMQPFLIILPSGKSKHPAVQKWVEFESQYFINRWQTLMRGHTWVKKDVDVTEEDIDDFNLICWGDVESNSIIRRAADKLPIRWNDDKIVRGERSWSAEGHVPALIHPNPLHPRSYNYIVLNSGLTFRDAHDKTNSQQNPKLPDWAIIDLSVPPNAEAPGRIADAGFFDEEWKLQEGDGR